jgi:lipopolysaccharide export system ATP-binding protein
MDYYTDIQTQPDYNIDNSKEGIVADKLVKIYGRKRVVDEVSFHVKQGEIVGLLGPNGAGKTTTFYMIVGLIASNGGNVYLDGKNIERLPMYKRALSGIGYLPQENSIFRKLTVEENIKAVLDIQGKDRSEIDLITDSLISELKLEHVRKQKAFTLSGGEKRRTEVARILAINPRFVLLDEPFTGIDPMAIEGIQNIITSLRDKRGIGILITDHNALETLYFMDRAYIVYEGQIKVEATFKELFGSKSEINEEKREMVKAYYLGENFHFDDIKEIRKFKRKHGEDKKQS